MTNSNFLQVMLVCVRLTLSVWKEYIWKINKKVKSHWNNCGLSTGELAYQGPKNCETDVFKLVYEAQKGSVLSPWFLRSYTHKSVDTIGKSGHNLENNITYIISQDYLASWTI